METAFSKMVNYGCLLRVLVAHIGLPNKLFRKKSAKCLAVRKNLTTFAPANNEQSSESHQAYLNGRVAKFEDKVNMVPVVQLVRASDCGSECRRFESVRAPKQENKGNFRESQ